MFSRLSLSMLFISILRKIKNKNKYEREKVRERDIDNLRSHVIRCQCLKNMII